MSECIYVISELLNDKAYIDIICLISIIFNYYLNFFVRLLFEFWKISMIYIIRRILLITCHTLISYVWYQLSLNDFII